MKQDLLFKGQKLRSLLKNSQKLILKVKVLMTLPVPWVCVQEATGVTFRSYTVPGIGTEPALVAAASAAAGHIAGPVKGNNGDHAFRQQYFNV